MSTMSDTTVNSNDSKKLSKNQRKKKNKKTRDHKIETRGKNSLHLNRKDFKHTICYECDKKITGLAFAINRRNGKHKFSFLCEEHFKYKKHYLAEIPSSCFQCNQENLSFNKTKAFAILGEGIVIMGTGKFCDDDCLRTFEYQLMTLDFLPCLACQPFRLATTRTDDKHYYCCQNHINNKEFRKKAQNTIVPYRGNICQVCTSMTTLYDIIYQEKIEQTDKKFSEKAASNGESLGDGTFLSQHQQTGLMYKVSGNHQIELCETCMEVHKEKTLYKIHECNSCCSAIPLNSVYNYFIYAVYTDLKNQINHRDGTPSYNRLIDRYHLSKVCNRGCLYNICMGIEAADFFQKYTHEFAKKYLQYRTGKEISSYLIGYPVKEGYMRNGTPKCKVFISDVEYLKRTCRLPLDPVQAYIDDQNRQQELRKIETVKEESDIDEDDGINIEIEGKSNTDFSESKQSVMDELD